MIDLYPVKRVKMFLNKRITILILLVLGMPLTFYAQGKNFIYIQSERKQPYYVIMNQKTNSSTAEGYIILSQIPQGKHIITIGFPKNLFPEQQFLLDIKEDKGYSFKKISDNSWQLFDLNNYTIINPITNIDSVIADSKKVVVAETRKADTVVVIKAEPKPAETIPVVLDKKVDDGLVKYNIDTEKPAPVVIEKKIETVVAKVEETKKPSSIRLILERQQASGIDKIFQDSTEYGIDTIAVYIPVSAAPKVVKTTTAIVTPTEVVKKEKAAFTDEEFRKLRLNMASAATDEDMIAVAVKTTSNKALEVKQIRNLSSLFLNESGKLSFFKAMKNNVKDTANFPALEAELNEPQNIAAFKNIQNNLP